MSDVAFAFIPPSPSSNNGIYLGPLFVHAYGLAYAVAVIAAVTTTVRRWEAEGGRRELPRSLADTEER
jgi:prolipoprotein diacylglyceryltransferase